MKTIAQDLPPKATTDQILANQSAQQRFYPVPGEDFWVSSYSKWTDRRWDLDNETIGAKVSSSRLTWDLSLPDGTNLLDQTHAELLEEVRRFVWGCFIDPRNSRPLKPGSLNNLGIGLRYLLCWMINSNYLRLYELDEMAPTRFVEDLQAYVEDSFERGELADEGGDTGEEDEDTGVHISWLEARLTPWSRLWNQRFALKDAGVGPVNTGDPFKGKSVTKQAEALAHRLRKKIPPLPDLVAVKVMNAADGFLEAAGDEMIRVAREVAAIRHEVSEGGSVWGLNGQIKTRKLVKTIQLGWATNHDAYWHPNKEEFSKLSIKMIRSLVDKVVGAAATLLHAETGMRASEILSLEAGINAETELPNGVTIRPSRSGMLDLFYVSGKTSKMRATPENSEWLLAARPRGSDIKPAVVRAIEIVHHLLAPWRDMADDLDARNALFIHWGFGGSFPVSGEQIVRINITAHSHRLKEFAAEAIDWDALSDDRALKRYKDSQGKCIRGHQYRKNYARFVFQVNPKMIPAVTRQFKHLSLAMTEDAYIGTDIDLIHDVAKENLNMTVDLLMQKARGKGPKHTGRLAKLMETYQSELATIIEGKAHADARMAMEAWCSTKDLKLFFHGYGSCIPGLAPTEAECHKRAQTIHWANAKPNYETREPSVCTGCYLFLAGEDTKQYWLQRYEQNMTAWLHAKTRGEEKQFHVAKARADQSATYLKVWDVELPAIQIDDLRMTNG